MRSPLRSPAQVEGTQGFLPQHGKALERPSSTRLEDRFPYHGSGAVTRTPPMVVFIAFSPLNVCFNFLTTYSEKELQFSDSVCYFTQSFVYFCLFFSSRRVPFSISCKAGLVLMNSCSFCLSGKAFVSPSYLNDNFFRYSVLGWQVLSFKILSMSFHSLLWSFCWEIC